MINELDNDLLISGVYYTSGKLGLITDKKEHSDSIEWYSILNDGSGNVSNCWDPDGYDYTKGTFNSVLALAKKIREKETKFQKFINKIFHNGSYKFSSYDSLLLLVEVYKIENERLN